MAGKPKVTKNAKIRIADNGYRFPEQLPVGEILIDSFKNQWTLGKAIARGGFGEIYEARPSVIKSNSALLFENRKGCEYVIKVDHLNGPLFCEMNFYIRAAKQEFISKWTSEKGIKFLGIPAFIAFGTHNKGDLKNGKISTKNGSKEAITRYRFLVMPRFGSDLQKVLDTNKLKLPLRTAYTIGIKILDALEYIHSHGYIHADIKASNLLLSFKSSQDAYNSLHDEIWLVDFGLVEKYLQAETSAHKPYEEDLRKANNGTIEFTSRDAHIGCFSRKGDCEILAYNLLSWLSGGRLPWMSNLQDKVLVKNLKNNYMDRLDDLLAYAFGNDTNNKSTQTKRSKTTSNSSNKLTIPDGIKEFFKLVIKMKYDDKPNYKMLKSILEKAIISSGEKYDGKFYLTEEINKRSSIKTPPKRKLPIAKSDKSNKSLKSNESSSPKNNYSDISVILDDEESDDEIMEIVTSSKRLRKSSAISKASSVNSNARKSPIVNGNIKMNGRRTPVNNSPINGNTKNHQNGKTIVEQNGNSKLINGDKLLNENGLNKIIDDNLNVDDKIRRRNPSRKVKITAPILFSPNTKKQHALIENNKLNNNLVNEPIKNGRVKQNSTTIYNKSENQIEFNGKILINPTPAMLELINHVNGKNK